MLSCSESKAPKRLFRKVSGSVTALFAIAPGDGSGNPYGDSLTCQNVSRRFRYKGRYLLLDLDERRRDTERFRARRSDMLEELEVDVREWSVDEVEYVELDEKDDDEDEYDLADRPESCVEFDDKDLARRSTRER